MEKFGVYSGEVHVGRVHGVEFHDSDLRCGGM